jgi:hypothetical protein
LGEQANFYAKFKFYSLGRKSGSGVVRPPSPAPALNDLLKSLKKAPVCPTPPPWCQGNGSEPIANADTASDFAARTGRDVKSRRNFRKNVNRSVLKHKNQAS